MQCPDFFQLISHRSLVPSWESGCVFSIHKWVVLPPQVWARERGWDEVVSARRKRNYNKASMSIEASESSFSVLRVGTCSPEWQSLSCCLCQQLPPLCEASLPWKPNYTPSSVRFLLINRAVREFTSRCHNCASKMDAKTLVRAHVFSPRHVAPLAGPLGLPPKALLYYHGLGPGHRTDSSLLPVGRDGGTQESFLSHLFLFLSKYMGSFPQGNERQTKPTNTAQEIRTSLFLNLPCCLYFHALLLMRALGGNR